MNNQTESDRLLQEEVRHVRELLARLATAARKVLDELEKPEIKDNPALATLLHRAAELRIVTDNSGNSSNGREGHIPKR